MQAATDKSPKKNLQIESPQCEWFYLTSQFGLHPLLLLVIGPSSGRANIHDIHKDAKSAQTLQGSNQGGWKWEGVAPKIEGGKDVGWYLLMKEILRQLGMFYSPWQYVFGGIKYLMNWCRICWKGVSRFSLPNKNSQ